MSESTALDDQIVSPLSLMLVTTLIFSLATLTETKKGLSMPGVSE